MPIFTKRRIPNEILKTYRVWEDGEYVGRVWKDDIGAYHHQAEPEARFKTAIAAMRALSATKAKS